jgi:hypothetical protein
MASATICPMLLICDDSGTPESFETCRIVPLKAHIAACEQFDIKILLSKVVLQELICRLPWGRMEDARWKGWLLDWWKGVLAPLEKRTRATAEDTPTTGAAAPAFCLALAWGFCSNG